MQPTNFEGTNLKLTRPEGWTEDQCGDMYVERGFEKDGTPFILECWKFSDEERKNVSLGSNLFVKIIGNGVPPIAVYTTNISLGRSKEEWEKYIEYLKKEIEKAETCISLFPDEVYDRD